MAAQHSSRFLALVANVKQQIKEITIPELQQLNQPYILFDIREDHEWQGGHIPKAEHLGKGIIERDIEQRVPDKTQTIVLYCGGGYRSALAADNLQKMGYSQVFSLDGGYRDWCQRALPIEQETKQS
ncbi:rhodanese-like domain-containing protein [Rheinheimera sp. WS51]|uniref:rhodanese-like domain-containing protein n=1 Tax=Rheinheimera sp. WS51 TaxID=3425886 RepID=UPI003D8E7DB3